MKLKNILRYIIGKKYLIKLSCEILFEEKGDKSIGLLYFDLINEDRINSTEYIGDNKILHIYGNKMNQAVIISKIETSKYLKYEVNMVGWSEYNIREEQKPFEDFDHIVSTVRRYADKRHIFVKDYKIEAISSFEGCKPFTPFIARSCNIKSLYKWFKDGLDEI